jgi:hypothetical protein
MGYAHRFRPTYAVANVGHPSDFLSRYSAPIGRWKNVPEG